MRTALLAVLLWVSGVPLVAALQSPPDCASTPYDCAIAQVQRQEFAAAIPTLERLVARTPSDLKALNLLGIALTGAGKPDAANVRFRAAIAIDPHFAPALRNLAVNEFRSGRTDAALRHFEGVLRQSPDDEIAHQHVGEIHFQGKHYRLALPHYEKSLARVMQQPPVILHYATCLLEQRRTPEAVAVLNRLPLNEPGSWFDAGVALGRYGAHAEAARFFGEARQNGYIDVYAAGYNQTLMLIDAGDSEAAIGVGAELLAQGLKRAELYSLVARAYANTTRIKEAYDALREATRLDPTVAEHYIDLAMLCLEHENYDLALEIVDVGLKHRPDSSMLYLQRGVVLAMKGASEEAEAEFSRASRVSPADPAPHVALAMVWMQRGQTLQAVDALRARTRHMPQPDRPQAILFYALGIALLRSGAAPDEAAGSEALEAFRTAVRLQPALAQAQSELGKLLLKRGDVAQAIAHLERAVSLEPQNAAPAYVLAQAYRRGGQTDRARELLERVSRLNAQERGDDPDTNLRRMMFRIVRDSGGTSESPPGAFLPSGAKAAAACAAAGDLDGALARLRALVASNPNDAEGRYQLAVTLWNRYQRPTGRRQKEDLDEAISTLTPAVERKPERAQFHFVLGQLLAEQQRFATALDHLRTATRLDPDKPEYPYALGLALRLHGDLDAADAQFRAALAKNPEHALARRSLGLVLRQKGDTAAAATELRRAATEMPDDPQGRYLLGAVLLRMGDSAGAVAELREAIRLNPSLTEARVTLAQALAKEGQKDAALQQQAEVHRLNAEKADFGRMLVLLDSSATLLARGDLAGAVAQGREAVALGPTVADAHFELGLALSEVDGSRVEAEAAFRQAIALDPGHARAYRALARLLELRGDQAAARASRARAAALAPCS